MFATAYITGGLLFYFFPNFFFYCVKRNFKK